MQTWFMTIVSSALINHLVLAHVVRTNPSFDDHQQFAIALRLAATTLIVALASTAANFPVNAWLLAAPDSAFLRTPAAILVIASVVTIVQRFMRSVSVMTNEKSHLLTALLWLNSTVIGIVMIHTPAAARWLDSIWISGAAGAGLGLLTVAFAASHRHIEHDNIPVALRGTAIAFITAGLVSLALLGFTGVVR
ncbi:MAG: Rnf-Nqr domain containing protein [Pseudomonadota bacterium]